MPEVDPRRWFCCRRSVLVAAAYGTAGFVLIEGWGLRRPYMTITTMTTVVSRSTVAQAGRLFAITLIVGGV